MRILLTITFLFSSGLLVGQVKEPAFPTPNAASLGKYGDIPVSYHTGVPDISIPIYTIQEGSLSVPISLSYHSSGIKVSETASWVGLGWSLNAGGMITRTVHGGPDEGSTLPRPETPSSPYGGTGWYKNNGFPSVINTCALVPISDGEPGAPGNSSPYGGCATIYYEASVGYIDTQPDLFTFNVNGQSGKFFFASDRSIHMIPEGDFKIEPMDDLFTNWKITGTDGTKYFFGGTAKETSCSNANETSAKRDAATSTTWWLYKIESANSESWVNFEYDDETYTFGNRGGHSVLFRTKDYNTGANAGQKISGEVASTSKVLSVSLVNGKRLKKITTSSGLTIIDFVPGPVREDLSLHTGLNVNAVNTNAKSLSSIDIIAGSLCKKFELNLDYFSSAECTSCSGADWYGTDIDKKRLRLNWVREISCSGVALPKYQFEYNPTLLPRRYSLARDYWEYYNGNEGNDGLLEDFSNPAVQSPVWATGDSRAVNPAKVKAGILTKVIYPTGGFNEFTYGLHLESGSSNLISGLRVESIITNDGSGTLTTKTFTYDFGKLHTKPAGYVIQRPNNNYIHTNAFLGELDFGATVTSSFEPPMYTSHGYHIAYGMVTVSQSGNGKTVYKFSNVSPTSIPVQQFPMRPVVATIGTSQQISEEIFNNSNVLLAGSFTPNKNIGTNVTVTPRKVETVGCLNCSVGRQSFGLWTDYSIITNRYVPDYKEEIKDGVTTRTTYTYDASPKHNNPRATEITDSRGVVNRTEFIYASDASSGAPAIMFNPATSPHFKNMGGTVVEQKMLVGGVVTGRTTSQFTNSGNKILLTSTKSYPTGTADYQETVYDYDANSNIINIIRSNGVNSSFIWSYNNSYPVAEAKNALQNQILYEGFENTAGATSIAKTGKKGFTGSYSVILPSAGTYKLTYWKRTGAGAWEFIEVGNVNSNQTIGGTGIDIDDVRLHPANALMTTYTYDVGYGISSVSDANGMASYYSYDALGRLISIRDHDGNISKNYQYNYKSN